MSKKSEKNKKEIDKKVDDEKKKMKFMNESEL
jgi:hypothetical protein